MNQGQYQESEFKFEFWVVNYDYELIPFNPYALI